MLRKELDIHTFNDLLVHFPIRHIDKTKVDKIASIKANEEYTQVAGVIVSIEMMGERRARRLVALLKDDTGFIELVWFQGINWVEKILHIGQQYLVFGKVGFFMGQPQLAHPEIENYTPEKASGKSFLEPIYPSTEKLKSKWLNGKAIGKLTAELLKKITEKDLPENLPESIIKKYKFITRIQAYRHIHFPSSLPHYDHAVRRLKFEEFFWSQFRINLIKTERHRFSKGWVFNKVGELFNNFFSHNLPFELTGAQKKVLKEIRKDMGSGRQMNRLLQGDVGSGKTMVALLSMLIAAGNAPPFGETRVPERFYGSNRNSCTAAL